MPTSCPMPILTLICVDPAGRTWTLDALSSAVMRLWASVRSPATRVVGRSSKPAVKSCLNMFVLLCFFKYYCARYPFLFLQNMWTPFTLNEQKPKSSKVRVYGGNYSLLKRTATIAEVWPHSPAFTCTSMGQLQYYTMYQRFVDYIAQNVNPIIALIY